MTLLNLLALSALINGFFFIIAAALRTDAFTDITYSLSFVALTALLLATAPLRAPLLYVSSGAVVLWGLRLGGYLFYRILRVKVDHRFDGMRDDVAKFGAFWLLQAISVWIILLPVYGIFSLGVDVELSPASLVPGIALFLAGFAIEAAADAQKFAFKSKPESKGRFMSRGLWKYSRHPNYFGEMLVWWGIALPGLFLFRGLAVLYFLGPVYLTLLLLFVSGIPLLEREAERKWGADPEYREYKRRTSLLVPLPRKRGR